MDVEQMLAALLRLTQEAERLVRGVGRPLSETGRVVRQVMRDGLRRFRAELAGGSAELVALVAQMLAVVIGDDPEAMVEGMLPGSFVRRLPAGTCVVPLSNPNSHNYPIGRLVVMDGTDQGLMRGDGRHGNHLPLSNADAWRFATAGEIKEAVGEASPEWLATAAQMIAKKDKGA